MDLIKSFNTLPGIINYNNLDFQLQLITENNCSRLGYILVDINQTTFKNPFFHDANKGFLILVELIENEQDFREAILEIGKFLVNNKLHQFEL